MRLSAHFLVSLTLSLLLYPVYGYPAFLALAGGFLIDVDHYAYYILKTGNLSIRKAIEFCYGNKTFFTVFCAFHNIEFLLFVALLGIFSSYFLILALGVFVHLVMDVIYLHGEGRLKREITALSLVTRFFIKRNVK